MEKRGLACSDLTDYIRCYLLDLAVSEAGLLARRKLDISGRDSTRLEEALDYAQSSWEDGKLFNETAPPDDHEMQPVCATHTIMTLTLRGNKQNSK
jgi:hypothetical protein